MNANIINFPPMEDHLTILININKLTRHHSNHSVERYLTAQVEEYWEANVVDQGTNTGNHDH